MKPIFFKKEILISNFVNHYPVIEGKINHIDFRCDGCNKTEYSLTECIYFTLNMNGYCQDCYNKIMENLKK